MKLRERPSHTGPVNRSLVVLAVLGGLAAGLAVAWRTHTASVEVESAPVVAEAPEQSEAPLRLQRASGKKQNPIGTLEVEVRAGGSAAPGIEVVVFRFERIEGAPTGQWLPPSRALTNGDGVARFEVPSVRHLVVAKLPKPLTRQIDVAGGATPDHVVLEAGVEVRLTGTTFDAESKQPLGQVDVTWRPALLAIAPDIASIRTQSDSLGRFMLETPQGVTGFLEAKAPGYSATTEPANSDTTTRPFELSLEPASVAQGVVVNPNGSPVAGASIRSQPSDGPAVLTSTDGTFMLQIPAGGVTLEATSSTGRRAMLRINAAPARETIRGIKMVIDEGSELLGRVIESSTQQPVGNATVRLFSEPDALEVATGTTNAAGQFHFAAIPAGRYSIFAQQGFGARGRTIGVELPSTTEPIVSLTASASIEGRVSDEAGQPSAGAEVVVTFPKPLGEPSIRVRTNEDGEFLIEGALASMVTISAKKGELFSSDDVYAAPDRVTRIDLSFEKAARIIGKVNNATVTYTITAWSMNGGQRGFDTETDAQGRFALTVRPGRWSVGAVPHNTKHGKMRLRMVNEVVAVKAGEDVTLDIDPSEEIEDGGREDTFFNNVADGIAFDSENGSVKVGFLTSQSLAFKTGLRTGDLVVSINGAPITGTLEAFAKARVEPAEYLIRRAGTEFRFRVTSESTD